MNKLIKELAEQSITEKLSLDEFINALKAEPHSFYGFRINELEKFVELIVIECVNVIRAETMEKLKESLSDDDSYDAGVFAGSIYARVAIKKHFGIE